MKSNRNSEELIKFGKRLKEVREGKDVSQEFLAFEAEISISQISRIERGVINTSISQVFSIAKVLKVEPKELFTF